AFAGALAFLAVVVRCLAHRPAGLQARAAAPLLLAGAAFLVVGPATALVRGDGATAPAFLAQQALGGGMLLAGLTYALAPVAVNQVPWSRRGAPWIALAAALGGAVLVASAHVAPALRLPGGALLGLAMLAHAANLAPMRKPRRECPPEWRVDEATGTP
ncbi:MAG TPA: hypothetical protein VI997_12225, partial [Candidatus Thermoplasmatota archaeon]|nr:hypothetical protein [Candidatus Thermoplasmatota archaeon]